MCLSTVYKGTAPEPENMLAEYVTSLELKDGEIHMTDITGDELRVRGALLSVDLVENRIFIAPEA